MMYNSKKQQLGMSRAVSEEFGEKIHNKWNKQAFFYHIYYSLHRMQTIIGEKNKTEIRDLQIWKNINQNNLATIYNPIYNTAK